MNGLSKIGLIWGRMFRFARYWGTMEKKEEVVLEIGGIAQFCFTNAVYVFSQMIIRMVIYFFLRLLHHYIYSPPGISIGLNVNLI